MTRTSIFVIFGLVPGVVTAQTPVERLQAVLPPTVAADVITVIRDADGQGLPGDVVARRVLEAHAKGQPDTVLSAAARNLEFGLGEARDAVKAAGREPRGDDIEAAAIAHDAGVGREAIKALAASITSERSLAVPLVVLATLVNEGVPADDALKAVEKKLSGRASNGELTDLPGEMDHDSGAKHDRGDAGHALGSRGTQGSGSSVSRPEHHPDDVPDNEGGSGKRPRRVDNFVASQGGR
jgi:hypothetical protein